MTWRMQNTSVPLGGSMFQILLGVFCVTLLLGPAPATAQRSGQDIAAFDGVKLEQRLGKKVPGDLTFRNAEGKKVEIGRYFDGERPVILNLVYHECPMLCNLMLEGLTNTLKEMAWVPGDQFEVLTVSFNYREGPELARKEKKKAVANLGKPKAAKGWHFLTGSEESVQRLTQAVGFHFNWIEQKKQFAHPSAVIFLSGDRTITRYLGGVNPAAGDTRKALVEASDGQVGNVLDQIVARCFQYDPDSNSYVADAFNIMRLGSILFVVVVGAVLLVFWRRENDRQEEGESSDSDAWGGTTWGDAMEERT